jgi:hypothetical protein
MRATILPLGPAVAILLLGLGGSSSDARADGPVPAAGEASPLTPLTPLTPPASAPPKGAGDHRRYLEPPSPLFPKVALGLGGAALVAGFLMIALDEDQDLDPRRPQSPSYHDTAGAGVFLFVVGAIAAGTGTYFLLPDRHAPAPIVTPLPGGGAVGWTGRF